MDWVIEELLDYTGRRQKVGLMFDTDDALPISGNRIVDAAAIALDMMNDREACSDLGADYARMGKDDRQLIYRNVFDNILKARRYIGMERRS